MFNFKIIDKNWTIEEIDQGNTKLMLNGRLLSGVCFAGEREIYLAKSMKHEQKREVLIHELSHAIISCTQANYEAETFNEETLCEFVGLYATEIIRICDEYFDSIGE